MPITFALALCLLCFALGHYWPRLRWIKNPKPHPAADPRYYLVNLDGTPHAFTLEALAVAADRARRIKDQSKAPNTAPNSGSKT